MPPTKPTTPLRLLFTGEITFSEFRRLVRAYRDVNRRGYRTFMFGWWMIACIQVILACSSIIDTGLVHSKVQICFALLWLFLAAWQTFTGYFSIPLADQRSILTRFGLCPICGYRRAAGVCPECGDAPPGGRGRE